MKIEQFKIRGWRKEQGYGMKINQSNSSGMAELIKIRGSVAVGGTGGPAWIKYNDRTGIKLCTMTFDQNSCE